MNRTPSPHVESVPDRLLRLLGKRSEGRAELVLRMVHREPSETTSYWLELVVAVGIATLGLVVASKAVIIGAMLIAPLMGPIVGLALGLASGSPLLVLRSSGRILLSVAVAVGGAAAITLVLPFHELNAEISGRASPTVLDLAIAAFCAVAGVYASLRAGSDTATTAAGTSIGISLVPPLCACGYGLGMGESSIAAGAGLLFLTNLVAIVLVGTVMFAGLGFGRVDVIALESAELAGVDHDSPITRVLASRLSRIFASGAGPFLRLAMPLFLLALVYAPLQRALGEVAWEVRVRAAAHQAIATTQRVVESRLTIERHQVHLVVVLLGTELESEHVHARLDSAIREAGGVTPQLEVLAVTDAATFAGLESLTNRDLSERLPVPPPSPEEELKSSMARLRSATTRLWPSDAAGVLLTVDVSTAEHEPLRVRVVHLGAPLAPGATETLERALASELRRPSKLDDVPVPPTELTRESGDLALIAGVGAGVRATLALPGVSVCVTRPETSANSPKADVELTRALDELLATHSRVTTTVGAAFSVRFVAGPCAAPPSTPPTVAQEAPSANGSAQPSPSDVPAGTAAP
jgi:uncharacterized hydrophobic protein (TIGR00271 family)